MALKRRGGVIMAYFDTALTILIVVGAAFYLVWKVVKGKGGCGCGCSKSDSTVTKIHDLRDKNG